MDEAQTPPVIARAPARWRGCLVWIGGLALVLGLLWYVGLRLAFGGELPWQVEWSHTSGVAVPDSFRVMVFPKGGSVPLLDESKQTQIGTVDRAMLASPSELASPYMPVTHAGVKGWVAMDRVTLSPPDDPARLVDRFNEEYRSRPTVSDKFMGASFQSVDVYQGSHLTLERSYDKHRDRFDYELRAGQLVPIEHAMVSDKMLIGDGMAAMFILLVLAVASGTIVVSAIGIWFYVRRRRRVSE